MMEKQNQQDKKIQMDIKLTLHFLPNRNFHLDKQPQKAGLVDRNCFHCKLLQKNFLLDTQILLHTSTVHCFQQDRKSLLDMAKLSQVSEDNSSHLDTRLEKNCLHCTSSLDHSLLGTHFLMDSSDQQDRLLQPHLRVDNKNLLDMFDSLLLCLKLKQHYTYQASKS